MVCFMLVNSWLIKSVFQSHCEKWEKTVWKRALVKGSEDKLSNKTVQLLISVAEYLAFKLDCKDEVCRVFTVVSTFVILL
jgi:hypothetical protein